MATIYERVKVVMDKYGVPPEVWYPIMMAESGGNPNAVGDAGASFGLFQLYTRGGQGNGYTRDQLVNPEINAEITAKHLKPAYDVVKGKYPDALLAAEVAIRSGHPAGSPTAPYRASVALYNAVKNWAAKGLPSDAGSSGGGSSGASGDGASGGGSSGASQVKYTMSGGGGLIDLAPLVNAILTPVAEARGFFSEWLPRAGLAMVGVMAVMLALTIMFLRNERVQEAIKTAAQTAATGAGGAAAAAV